MVTQSSENLILTQGQRDGKGMPPYLIEHKQDEDELFQIRQIECNNGSKTSKNVDSRQKEKNRSESTSQNRLSVLQVRSSHDQGISSNTKRQADYAAHHSRQYKIRTNEELSNEENYWPSGGTTPLNMGLSPTGSRNVGKNFSNTAKTTIVGQLESDLVVDVESGHMLSSYEEYLLQSNVSPRNKIQRKSVLSPSRTNTRNPSSTKRGTISQLAKHERNNRRGMSQLSPNAFDDVRVSHLSMPQRLGTSLGFRPRRGPIDAEIPKLRKKYEGGIWGYGQRVSSEVRTAANTTKILLSHTKKSQHEFSFSNLHQTEDSKPARQVNVSHQRTSNNSGIPRQLLTSQNIRGSVTHSKNKNMVMSSVRKSITSGLSKTNMNNSYLSNLQATTPQILDTKTSFSMSRPHSVMGDHLRLSGGQNTLRTTLKIQENQTRTPSPSDLSNQSFDRRNQCLSKDMSPRQQQQQYIRNRTSSLSVHHKQRQQLPLQNQCLSDLVQMNLQVQFEKYRRRPDDW